MHVVLITGCSRGIGHHLALALADRGWTVVGTLRSADVGAPGRAALDAAGVQVATCDVTDPARCRAVVDGVLAEHGRLDAVVANAGGGLLGCFEDLDPDQIHALFALNVFGAMHTVRAALPALRASRGRVVVVSSVAGRRSAPGSSAYNATKFAVEGWGEALRFELAPFGVPVVLVEPGATRTGFLAARDEGPRSGRGPYAEITRRIRALNEETFASATSPDVVVGVLVRALTADHPPLRLPVGAGVRAQILVRRVLPEPVYERLVAWKLALPSS